MPCLRDHAAAGCVGLGVLFATQTYLPGTRIDHLAWGACFMIGNLLPDIGNYFYARKAREMGYEIDLNQPASWDRYEWLFDRIDDEFRWLHPYKWLHSFACWATGLAFVYWLEVVHLPGLVTLPLQALIYGSLTHAVMDAPLHKRNWLLFPFVFKALRGFSNWWKLRWLMSRAWKAVALSVLGITGVWHAAYAAYAAWYLIP